MYVDQKIYIPIPIPIPMYDNYRHKMFSKRFELRPQLPQIQMPTP